MFVTSDVVVVVVVAAVVAVAVVISVAVVRIWQNTRQSCPHRERKQIM